MKKRFDYDILYYERDQANIWKNDKELIDLLDRDDCHATADYYKHDKLIARSYRLPKQHLELLRRDYAAKIY